MIPGRRPGPTVRDDPAVAAARAVLADAVDAVLHLGLTVPCVGRPEWTSEDPESRALAALGCAPCPVWGPCGAAAEAGQESAGVWAGHDRSVR